MEGVSDMKEHKSVTIHGIFGGGVSQNNPWNPVSFSSAPKAPFSIHVAVL